MPRYGTILAFACTLSCGLSHAQEIQQLTRKLDKKEIPYALYLEDGVEPQGILLGFHPYNPGKWDALLWAKTLQPLAENNRYLLLCPDGGADNLVDSTQFDEITELARFYQDSLSLHGQPVLVAAFSLGANAAMHYYSGETPVTGALLVSPTQMPSLRNQFFDDKVFAFVYGAEEAAAGFLPALGDSLKQKGAWVWETEVPESGHTFAIPDYYKEYDDRIHWLDSVGRILSNPAQLEQMQVSTGLQNKIPEQMRQGQAIQLEYFAARPLRMNWSVLDLSGKALLNGNTFFGKGPNNLEIPTRELPWGVYRLELNTSEGKIEKYKFIIRG